MKKIISIILSFAIITSITYTNVYADNIVRGVFNKQQEFINYGIELMDMENSKAFEIYMALLNVNTKTGELKIDFNEPVRVQGKNKEEIESIDSDIIDGIRNDAQMAMDAFCSDYPEIFWYDIENSMSNMYLAAYTDNDNNKYYAIKGLKINLKTITEYEGNVDSAYDEVLSKLNQVVSETEGLDRYNTLKYFHDFLVDSIEYGSENYNSFNMHGALVNNTAVCEGYSESFKALCDLAGIPCVIIKGKSLDLEGNEENHMWNYCLMEDDKWYAVDVTWDDIGYPCYDFFLVGSKTVVMINDRTFNHTHLAIGDFSFTGIHEFTYPLLNETAYEVIEFMYGDINADMIINGSDALEALKMSARLKEGSESEIKAGDVDGNGNIDSKDALYILQYAAKLINTFPIEMNKSYSVE